MQLIRFAYFNYFNNMLSPLAPRVRSLDILLKCVRHLFWPECHVVLALSARHFVETETLSTSLAGFMYF